MIGTVRTTAETGKVSAATAGHVVALSANADLDAAIVRNGAVAAAYASAKDRPELPFWPMPFANVTIRLLGTRLDSLAPAAMPPSSLRARARKVAFCVSGPDLSFRESFTR